jgi:hypothetical protein
MAVRARLYIYTFARCSGTKSIKFALESLLFFTPLNLMKTFLRKNKGNEKKDEEKQLNKIFSFLLD